MNLFFDHLRKNFREHLFFTIFAASLLTIANDHHLFDQLDMYILNIGSSYQTPAAKAPGTDRLKQTVVVLLGKQLFENHFDQRSPLDRHKLSNLLKKLLDKKPSLLAIDLDLSPVNDDKFGDLELKSLLLDAGKNGSVPISLITPIPVISEQCLLETDRWMTDICSSGIKFALPLLQSNQGVVLYHDPHKETLGNITADQYLSSNKFQNRYCDEDYRPLAISKQGFEFLTQKPHKTPLNFGFISQVSIITLNDKSDMDKIGDLTGKAVFFGPGYKVSDIYLTPRGHFPGVVLHAAAFYTNIHSINEIGHYLSFLLEIIIGVMVGGFFSFAWEHHSRYLQEEEIFCAAILWILNVFLFLLLLWGILRLSHILLQMRIWMNLGMLIIGVCFKVYVSKWEHFTHNSSPLKKQTFFEIMRTKSVQNWNLLKSCAYACLNFQFKKQLIYNHIDEKRIRDYLANKLILTTKMGVICYAFLLLWKGH